MRPVTRLAVLVTAVGLGLVGVVAPAGAETGVAPRERQVAPAPAPMAAAFALQATPEPEDLAAAMGVPRDDIVSADLMGSDPVAFAVETGAANGFPSSGSSYLVMSTGNASAALQPNVSSSTTTVLGGIDNQQGNDLARLHLALRPPIGAQCLAFDVAFFSEEFPEYVNKGYSDAFTAQMGSDELRIESGEVVAVDNFAFDERGEPLSVNTAFGIHPDTSTTYDGGTVRLRAVTPVFNPFVVDLYLSIQDLGDSSYDSAAFLDGFFWSRDTSCTAGSTKDSDGDGLLDDWETRGLVYVDDDGQHVVDLPTMGADPAVPDIFVEIDHMAADGAGDSHAPKPEAIATVVDSFARHGVHLHVDYGRNAPLRWGKQATWGDLSRAEVLPHQTYLGAKGFWQFFQYSWSDFNDIKRDHFDDERSPVFHYNVWAHQQEEGNTSSGIARIDGSDFIVSLGAFDDDRQQDVTVQAGTFMHELGHNLGLHHGGGDDANRKPNYLSIMNYAFQLAGLPTGSATPLVDYSSTELDPIFEGGFLDEPVGIGIGRWTYHSCENGSRRLAWGRAIDWNCDGDTKDTSVWADVNDDDALTQMNGYDDWAHLNFTGGGIGRPGAILEQDDVEQYDGPEATPEDLELVGPDLGEIVTDSTAVRVGRATHASVSFPARAVATSAVEVTVSWGDGSTSPATLASSGTTWTATGSHVYAAPGTYDVTVVLSGAAGSSGAGPAAVEVVDAPAAPDAPALQVGSSTALTNAFTLSGDAVGTTVVHGDLRCDSSVHLAGDVHVTGTGYLTNSCTVEGTLTVAGDVVLDSTPRVGGDLVSGGSVLLGARVHVGGSVRAAGTVRSAEGLSVTQLVDRGVVGGSVEPGVPVTLDAAPAQPVLAFDPEAWSAQRVSWAAWLNAAADANNAPTWSAGRTATPGCTLAPWASSINGASVTVGTDTLVDARRSVSGCAAVTVQAVELRLAGDLTVVADSVAAVGGLRAVSADGAPHTLRVLVPGGGEIRVPEGGTVDPLVTVQLATPGTVRLNGTLSLTGQVVAGALATSGKVTLVGRPVQTPELG